jgi:hypothetical protein
MYLEAAAFDLKKNIAVSVSSQLKEDIQANFPNRIAETNK